MQPEPIGNSIDASQHSIFTGNTTPAHHGLLYDDPSAESPLHREDSGRSSDSPSEWTLSPATSGLGSPPSNDAGLSPQSTDLNDLNFDLTNSNLVLSQDSRDVLQTRVSEPTRNQAESPKLYDFPEGGVNVLSILYSLRLTVLRDGFPGHVLSTSI